ncbi:alpha/beta fold hydrolase [Kovacikia minuta CCNUW1]|uniref:alpha/beta hydrolase n=1 Tax=Kovacikia minuta TaxID=2931930 RepID=UPI001CCBC9EE|nr:alpha/beta fold hydrolase [Kovacikia minuta]UBF24976.1 alpha/beta fold hydrolase [Kovacikia minuta CCNUW1]
MFNYSDTAMAIAQQAKMREDALPLLNQSCRSRFFFQPKPTKRVCLFFHGFTAGPYQFVPMAEAFFRAGYNVLIPLLPGHGQAGNWNRNNPPPLPTDPKIYQQFGLQWLELAQTLGEEVIIGGLSAGGTLTAWLALERPQAIYRALLFAAYLSSSSKVVDLFVRSFDTYFEWQAGKTPSTQTPLAVGGYSGFSVAGLRTFLNMGQDILKRAQRQPTPPLFIVSSESDIAVGNMDHKALFENALHRQPLTWYQRFDRTLAIPHTMMTKTEGNRWENLLNVMAKAFVESNLTWAEVEEIGYRMGNGRTFDQVVAELGWQQKVSRDMPAMMTMVDKRAIAIARSGGLD